MYDNPSVIFLRKCTSLYTREAFFWFSPYYLGLSFMSVGVGALDDPNIVGDDILGVPFIKNHYVLHGLPRTSTPTDLCEI